jgi:hypothetical protein
LVYVGGHLRNSVIIGIAVLGTLDEKASGYGYGLNIKILFRKII